MDDDYLAAAFYGGPTVNASKAADRLKRLEDGFYTLVPTAAVADAADDAGGWSLAEAFDPKNLGTTLGGIGAVIGGIGGIWSALKQQDRYDDMYRMEKRRIADLKAQHDKTEKTFADAWG